MVSQRTTERRFRCSVLHTGNTRCGGSVTRAFPGPRCCWLVLAGLLLCTSAAADDGNSPNADEGSSFVFELRTFGGVARHRLSNTDESTYRAREVVDFDAVAAGVAARAGFDLSAHVRMGAALSVEQYWRTGKFAVHDAEAFGDEYFQFDDTPRLWSPIALFAEVHPWSDLGAFVGLNLGLGYLPPVAQPRPRTIDAGQYLAGYALELGYGSTRSSRHGWGVFLRYSAWAGGESPLHTDTPEGLTLGEWTLGGRWTFCP